MGVMCICICASTHYSVHTYTHACLNMPTCTRACTHMCVHTDLCAPYEHMCIHAYVYSSIWVCMHTCICMYGWACVRAYMREFTFVFAHTYVCPYTNLCTYVHKSIRAFAHACKGSCVRPSVRAYAYIRVLVYEHTCAHTNGHTCDMRAFVGSYFHIYNHEYAHIMRACVHPGIRVYGHLHF